MRHLSQVQYGSHLVLRSCQIARYYEGLPVHVIPKSMPTTISGFQPSAEEADMVSHTSVTHVLLLQWLKYSTGFTDVIIRSSVQSTSLCLKCRCALEKVHNGISIE